MSSVQIKRAGAFIAPLLKTDQDGKIIGITSKGIFLLFGEKVVFLTDLKFENPFSLILDDRKTYPGGVSLATPVRLSGKHLRIGEYDYDVSALIEISPEKLPQMKAHTLKGTTSAQVLSIFQMLDRAGHEDSCLFVVDTLLNKHLPGEVLKRDLCDAAQALRNATQAKDLAAGTAALQAIIGRGKGLTPSGDDFIAGYLLVLNCLLDRNGKLDEFTKQLNAAALEIARSRTTWISANLIEAAIQRLVDERIGMAAMVLLNTCKMDPISVAHDLESFGSSSGIDAFSGMAAALLP